LVAGGLLVLLVAGGLLVLLVAGGLLVLLVAGGLLVLLVAQGSVSRGTNGAAVTVPRRAVKPHLMPLTRSCCSAVCGRWKSPLIP
jgi:hypothetical protein